MDVSALAFAVLWMERRRLRPYFLRQVIVNFGRNFALLKKEKKYDMLSLNSAIAELNSVFRENTGLLLE